MTLMLVTAEATDAFVTILPDGDMVSAIRGQRVTLPKAVADKLAKADLVRLEAPPRQAPENKAEGGAPEVKAPRKRATKKSAKAPAAAE